MNDTLNETETYSVHAIEEILALPVGTRLEPASTLGRNEIIRTEGGVNWIEYGTPVSTFPRWYNEANGWLPLVILNPEILGTPLPNPDAGFAAWELELLGTDSPVDLYPGDIVQFVTAYTYLGASVGDYARVIERSEKYDYYDWGGADEDLYKVQMLKDGATDLVFRKRLRRSEKPADTFEEGQRVYWYNPEATNRFEAQCRLDFAGTIERRVDNYTEEKYAVRFDNRLFGTQEHWASNLRPLPVQPPKAGETLTADQVDLLKNYAIIIEADNPRVVWRKLYDGNFGRLNIFETPEEPVGTIFETPEGFKQAINYGMDYVLLHVGD